MEALQKEREIILKRCRRLKRLARRGGGKGKGKDGPAPPTKREQLAAVCCRCVFRCVLRRCGMCVACMLRVCCMSVGAGGGRAQEGTGVGRRGSYTGTILVLDSDY